MTTSQLAIATLPQWVGKDLGVSKWIAVGQDRIDAFARSTGDHQWIHVDPERAKTEGPFGGPVAHGFLTLSLLADMNIDIGVVPTDAVAALNHGIDKVWFLAPVRAGARIRAHAKLIDVTDQGDGRVVMKLLNTIEIEGEAKSALIAETSTMVLGRASCP